MSEMVESQIIGTFFGYAPGVVHRLDDAGEWEQLGNTKEFVLPRATRLPGHL
jgi:hypothetical protein